MLWAQLFIYIYSAMMTIDMCGAQVTPDMNSPYHLVFEEIGEMASSLSYIHTALKINVSQMETNLDTIVAAIQRMEDKTLRIEEQKGNMVIAAAKAKILQSLQVHLHDIYHEKVRLTNLRALLPEPPKSTEVRDKRSVFQLFFGALGTFIGLFSDAKINRLQESLSSTIANQQKIINVISAQTKTIEHIGTTLTELKHQIYTAVTLNPAAINTELQSLLAKVKAQTDQVFVVLQQAQHRRLALDFLTARQITQLHDSLLAASKQAGADLIIKNPTDIFQLEMSYFFDGNQITLLLHVPLVPEESMLRLIKIHPFPLPLSEHFAIVPDISNEILAISAHSIQYSVQFPATDLLGCHQVNEIHLCQGKGVLNKRMSSTCLGALYTQNFQQASKLCPMKIIEKEETIYKLNNNQYLIFSPLGQTVTIRCKDAKSHEELVPKGISNFHLEEGCRTDLTDHLLIADYNINLETTIRHVALPREENMDIPHLSNDELEKHLKTLHRRGIYQPTINEIVESFFEQIDDNETKFNISTVHTNQQHIFEELAKLSATNNQIAADLNASTPFVTFIIIISCTILVLFIIFCLLCYFYKQFRYQVLITLSQAFGNIKHDQIPNALTQFIQSAPYKPTAPLASNPDINPT